MTIDAGQSLIRDELPAAVLWDMDGTLVDSEKLWSIALDDYAAHRGGVLSAATRKALVGSNMERTVRVLLEDLGLPSGAADREQAARWVERRAAELFAAGLPWRPGAEEALSAVRASGTPTALVTSTVRSLTDIALHSLGRDRFDVIVCGDEVGGRNKPDPEPYLRACRMLGVRPEACVVFEDSPAGTYSAVAAGCTVIGIPCEVPLEAGPRCFVCESLLEVDMDTLGELLSVDESEQAGVATHTSG